jgi:hypothetical protein
MASSFKSPILQAIDQNGNPVPGAKLFVFASGTTTPVVIYSNQSLTTPLPNPLIANARGYFASAGGIVQNIWWAGEALRLRLTDVDENVIWEIDNYTSDAGFNPAANLTITGDWNILNYPRGATPRDFGAVGDGVADDTAAVLAWAQAGGGVVDRGARYLIDPIVVTNETHVWAYGATFIQRSPFAGNSSSQGLITLTGGGTWIGGRYDGQRDNPAVNSYVAALRGTSNSDRIDAYKCAVYVTCPNGVDRTYDVGDFEIVDFPGHGLYVVGNPSGRPGGRFRTNVFRRCGYGWRFDRVKNALIEWQQAEDTCNFLDDDVNQWMPTVVHIGHYQRCNDCTVQGGAVRRALMRPRQWGAGGFANGITTSNNFDCTFGPLEVDGFALPQVAASDTGGTPISGLTSVLLHSFVSNRRCPSGGLYAFRSVASQAVEIIVQDYQYVREVVLEGNYGRQGTGSGGDGLNIHGRSQGYQELVSASEQKRQGILEIGYVNISGFHRGILHRKNKVSIRGGKIYGNRIDGISVGANISAEWGWPRASAQVQKPSLYLHDVDVYNNGLFGVRLVRGDEFVWMGGRSYDNGQRSGFTDPTLTNSYWITVVSDGGVEAVKYDASRSDASATWRNVQIADVDTRSRGAATLTAEAGFMNGTPAANDWIPDNRLRFMLLSLKNPSEYERGQRLRIDGVNTAQDENINVWIADVFGDLVLAEVDQTSGAYAGAWDADANAAASSVAGTWNYNGGGVLTRASGTNGTAITDITGPCFIRADGEAGFAFLTTVDQIGGVDTLYVLQASDFGVPTTWSAAFSGKALEIIQVDAQRSQAQPTNIVTAMNLTGITGITNARNIRGFGGFGFALYDNIELGDQLQVSATNTRANGLVFVRQADAGGAASMRYQAVHGAVNISWSTGMRVGAAPAAQQGVFCIQAATSISTAAPFALTTSGTLGLGFTSGSAPNRHQDINTSYVLDNNGNVNVRGTVHVGAVQVVGARVINANIADPAAITAQTLTDNSGGTASTTIAAIGATYDQGEVRNAVASLADQINKLKADVDELRAKSVAANTTIRTHGLGASS